MIEEDNDATEQIAELGHAIMDLCAESGASPWVAGSALIHALAAFVIEGGKPALCEERLGGAIDALRDCARQSSTH